MGLLGTYRVVNICVALGRELSPEPRLCLELADSGCLGTERELEVKEGISGFPGVVTILQGQSVKARGLEERQQPQAEGRYQRLPRGAPSFPLLQRVRHPVADKESGRGRNLGKW